MEIAFRYRAKVLGLSRRFERARNKEYRSWLDETGAPMKVQQELMRHASIQTTMNVYGQAMTDSKRRANSQVVSLVFGVPTQTIEGSVAIQ